VTTGEGTGVGHLDEHEEGAVRDVEAQPSGGGGRRISRRGLASTGDGGHVSDLTIGKTVDV
jgi:hypothetical protein